MVRLVVTLLLPFSLAGCAKRRLRLPRDLEDLVDYARKLDIDRLKREAGIMAQGK